MVFPQNVGGGDVPGTAETEVLLPRVAAGPGGVRVCAGVAAADVANTLSLPPTEVDCHTSRAASVGLRATFLWGELQALRRRLR